MGSSELTQREQQVLQLVAAAESNKSIARALGLSVHTVKRHVARIIAKMGAASRAEAAARWRASQQPAPPAAAAPLDAFTSRERDVIARVVLGQSNMEIASQLAVSVNTVKRHTANILDKLAVSSRIEAAALLEARVKAPAPGAARYHEEPMR
jgi:DNA-binding NarL/FixJ family response regulator